jgi:hypothetical protein
MDKLLSFYPHNPALILLVSGIFFVGYLLLRNAKGVSARGLLLPATAWLVAAIWEEIMVVFSPEADIRVDLFLILPLLLLLSLWGIVRTFWWRKA